MGRAIEVDKRLDKLEHQINEVLLMLEELSEMGNEEKDEETKQEKTNNETGGKSGGKSNNGNKKKSNRDTKDTASSKWLYRV